MVSFKILLMLEYGPIRGCEALDLTRRLKLQESTYVCSMGFDHRLEFDVDEAFARSWFPTLDCCQCEVSTKHLMPADVEMPYVEAGRQHQIRLSSKMTVERAKELFVATRTVP